MMGRMDTVDVWRLTNAALALLGVITFGAQTWGMWGRLDERRRYLCLSLTVLLATVIYGSVENTVQHNPGGTRLAVTTVACLWVLFAVHKGRPTR